jgi:alkyl sulfatase BDS1-like metallo-beta-lactamase superfamily hydrolase
VAFLSSQWVAALADVAVGVDNEALKQADVCIQHVVTDGGGDDTPVHYWVRVRGGHVTTGMGDAPDADVWVTTDRDTAAALARNEASAQEVFRAGRLRLHGDVSRLVAWSAALRELENGPGA